MAKDTDNAQTPAGGNVAGLDVIGSWPSWVQGMAASDARTPDVLAGGVKQLEEALSKDPVLRSMDEMWNANPLREIVPIDWAEIARALRIVWLRSLRKP